MATVRDLGALLSVCRVLGGFRLFFTVLQRFGVLGVIGLYRSSRGSVF